MIETDPERAIKLLEARYASTERLDPADREAVRDADGFLHADVSKVFGAESDEYSQFWQHHILDEPFLLRTYDDEDDDLDEGSWRTSNKLVKAKAGIEKMLPRIRRLIDRARELAALRGEEGGDPVNPFKALEQHFQLIKPTGERLPSRGIWGDDVVTVHNARFLAATGDAVERTLPNGVVERREVANVRFEKGIRPIPDAYHLDLHRSAARPAAPAPIVNQHTTYNIHGPAAAVGPNAQATGNTIIGQATQWNGVDRDRLAGELGKLRVALAAEAGEDDDAMAELSRVGDANTALKASDEAGFVGAVKKLGSKAWGIVQSLGLAYLDQYARKHLGLPPPGGA